MTTRYEIIALKRASRGFRAVLVDNLHPSGVKGIAIRWFKSVDDAIAHLGATPFTFTIQK